MIKALPYTRGFLGLYDAVSIIMASCYSKCFYPCRIWSNVDIQSARRDNTTSSDRSMICTSTHSNECHNHHEQQGANDDVFRRTRKTLRVSICLKLTIFVGFLVVVAAGIPALILWLNAHERLVGEIERRLTTVCTLRQEQLRDYLDSEMDKAHLISIRVIIKEYMANMTGVNKTMAESDLTAAVQVISDFLFAACYDSEGHLAIATNYSAFKGTMDSKDLYAVQKSTVTITNPEKTSLGWMYSVSRAIYQKRTMIGVLMTWVNATKLADLVYDRTGLQKTGEILIGMPEGDDEVRFLFPPHSNQSYTIHRRYGAMEKAINGEAGIDIMHDYKNEKVIAAYRPVGFMRWGLIAKLDISEAYAPVKNVWTVIISTIPSLVLAGILASLGLAKVFSRPIVDLGRAAIALGRGDISTRIRKGALLLRDELDDLKDIFNSMAHQITYHNQILERTVAERTADLACANEGLANEINERRKIETELEKAKNIALAANKSKSEFLANMSHELRTPLNAIVNFTEFCLGTKVTLEQKEQLEQVQFAAQHLLRLITDILDLSKIEAGKLEIEEIEFSLFHQLEHAISVFAARALENDIELCSSFGEDVPDHIVGDPGRLLQILVNLIGNGIKFTKKGEVVTTVLVKSRTVETVELLFSVRDTGMGIPEDKKSLLFQAFSHIDSSTQRLYSGTGLGLLISAKLAAAMKGRMWVESDGIEDHGSTFWFTAVFQLQRISHERRRSKPHLKGVRCLVVDDNVTCRTTLTNLLKTWGAEAHAEGTVEAALSVLQRAASLDQKYNIVLLDLWLKGTDSSDFIFNLHREPTLLENCTSRNIQRNNSVHNYDSSSASDYERASDNETKTVIIGNNSASNLSVDSIKCLDKSSVFNSGNEQNSKHNIGNDLDGVISNSISGSPKEIAQERQADPYLISDAFRIAKVSRSAEPILPSVIMLTSVNHMDVDRCKELGVPNHVPKPIKRELLLRVLKSALGLSHVTSLAEDKETNVQENSTKSLHILVAEDNVINQRVAVTYLQKWGHTAVLAENGVEAVEKAAKEQFDLILMDVQMPLCDGFEATSKIRELERSQNKRNPIPIVAMTAHAMCGDGDRCIAAGMDYYISKPLNGKKLQDLLWKLASNSTHG